MRIEIEPTKAISINYYWTQPNRCFFWQTHTNIFRQFCGEFLCSWKCNFGNGVETFKSIMAKGKKHIYFGARERCSWHTAKDMDNKIKFLIVTDMTSKWHSVGCLYSFQWATAWQTAWLLKIRFYFGHLFFDSINFEYSCSWHWLWMCTIEKKKLTKCNKNFYYYCVNVVFCGRLDAVHCVKTRTFPRSSRWWKTILR